MSSRDDPLLLGLPFEQAERLGAERIVPRRGVDAHRLERDQRRRVHARAVLSALGLRRADRPLEVAKGLLHVVLEARQPG